MIWLQFLATALVIVLAGVPLARYGDVLGEKTGLANSHCDPHRPASAHFLKGLTRISSDLLAAPATVLSARRVGHLATATAIAQLRVRSFGNIWLRSGGEMLFKIGR
jgi:hypothetical protein